MNWVEEWNRKVKSASSRRGWGLFSRKDFARWYDFQLQYNGYPGILLEKVLDCLDGGSTMLDIGAGTGAFAIPAAKRICKVTAVEPSAGMRACLIEKINGQGNIRIIDKLWEDIDEDEIDRHDMVFAANSLYRISSILPALEKMLAVSRKYLCVIMSCKSSLYSDMWYKFKGEDYHSPPSFIYLYNILYGMGIIADVRIISKRHYYIYRDVEQALNYWSVRLGLGGENRICLEKHLKGIFRKTENGLYYEEEGKDAIIWYEKK